MPMSQCYPIHLQLSGKLCVVVGGGSVGERRAIGLRSAGAVVRVVAPRISPRLQSLFDDGEIEVRPKEYSREDIEGAFLVVAAANNRAVNAQVAQDAKTRSILVNVADAPTEGDFVVPATFQRGDLEISVSTGGSLPALSQRIVAELQERFGDEFGDYVELLGEIRDYMKENTPLSERKERVSRVLESERSLCALLREGKRKEARELAFRLLKQE